MIVTSADPLRRWLVIPPVLATVVVCAPLLADPLALVGGDTFRAHDWLESAKLDAFSRMALLRWHALPHWNPWLQGGLPQLAHPSDGSLSPFVLPCLLLGQALGMKVSVMISLALGAAGIALLGRDRAGLRPRFAAFAGCAFAVAGWVPSRVVVGYYESCLYAYFPLVAWAVLTGGRRRPLRLLGAAVGVAVAAAQLHLGLLVLVLILVVLVAAESVERALPARRLVGLTLVLITGAGLAAAKLVPMVGYLRERGFRTVATYPESWGDQWYGSLQEYLRCGLHAVPLEGVYADDGMTLRAEFGYVGLGLPMLLLIALAILRLHRLAPGARATFVLGLLFTWFCFGPNCVVDGFHALWQLPGFHSMHGSVRYLSFGLVWAGCVLAAAGLQAGADLLPSGWFGRVGWLVAAAAVVWPTVESGRRYRGAFDARIEPPTEESAVFVQQAIEANDEPGHARGGSPRWDEGNLLVYRNQLRGVGTIYTPADLPFEPLPRGREVYVIGEGAYTANPDYRGEVWCDEHDCVAEVVDVAANRFGLSADLERADLLVLNQSHDPRWSWDGGEVVSARGLLAVRVESPGPVEVELRYVPRRFRLGAAISLSTLLLAGAAAVRVRRRHG